MQNEAAAMDTVSNGLAGAFGLPDSPIPGIGVGGLSPQNFVNTPGFPGYEGGEATSSSATMFKNLRWYLVTNFRQMLSQAYAELGLVQTIVDVPVDDALRGGIDIKSLQLKETQIEELRAALERDGDLTTMGLAAKWERLFGGGGVIIMVPGQDPKEPLDLDTIEEGAEVGFRACDLWELSCDGAEVPGDGDLLEEGAEGEDELSRLQGYRGVKFYTFYGVQVHHSRVLRLVGKEAPSYIKSRLRGWGLSVCEVLVRSINQYLKATNLAFEVLDEFKVDVYQFKNLVNTLMAPGGEQAIFKRVAIANQQKNYQSAVVLDSEDMYTNKQLSFTGLAEVMTGIRMQVASDMRMPITKLFGISATGFNSGQDDIEVYNAMVESQVRTPMKFDLLRMIEIKCAALFGFVPDDLSISFKPLRVLSAVDEETVKTQKFARLIQAKQAGEITTKQFLDACNKGGLLDITIDTDDASLDELDAENAEDTPEQFTDDDTETEDDDAPPQKPGLRLANWFRFKFARNDDFDEDKHPRADDGKFGAGGGGKSATKEKKSREKKSKPLATIADNGQIKLTRPKSVEDATNLLKLTRQYHADAEAASETDKSPQQQLRLRHAAKQYLKAMKMAREVHAIATGKKSNVLGAQQPITTTTHVSKKKVHAKYLRGITVMPKPFSVTERARRTINSGAFDRASYAADGGDSWIDGRRAEFFKTMPIHADAVLWRRAEDASREAFGSVKWQFVVWFYKKNGGTL